MKNIYRFCFISFGLFILTACEDALNKMPLDAPSDETFFSNQTELELAINGAYRDIYWRSGSNPFHILLDNASDIGFIRGSFSGMETYAMGSHSSLTDAFSVTWERMYSGIGRCNNLLDKMVKAKAVVPEAFYNQTQAEALFLRAYYYFWLTELYGDVPLVTSVPTSIAAAKIPKNPKNEIVAFLFADLDKAINVLPVQWPDPADKGRATKGAALTLKARMALMNAQYEVAATTAKQIIDMKVYSLYPNYADLFTYAGERSAEVIFDMPFETGFLNNTVPREQGPRNGSGFSQFVPSQFMIDSYECIDGLTIDKSPLYNPAKPFERRDPRLDASIVRPQSLFATYIYETHPDSLNTTRIVNGKATRVANQDVRNAFASFTGYLWRKYTSEADIPANRTVSALNYILMRYAEVLLTYAEAKIELGEIDSSVLNAINQVRARAYGVPVSQTSSYPSIVTVDENELRSIIRRERKVELADEGFRMLDIHRWRIAEYVMPGALIGRPKGAYSLMTFVPQIDEHGHPRYEGAKDLYRVVDTRIFDPSKDYLWPIPQKEIDVNPAIKQNPNY